MSDRGIAILAVYFDREQVGRAVEQFQSAGFHAQIFRWSFRASKGHKRSKM
jgi:hypothetical protein